MKIYTKTGDKGNTSLFDGRRVPKHHQRIEAYGTLDELNAYIGLLITQSIAQEYKRQLGSIQNELFVLGAQLANPKQKSRKSSSKTPEIESQHVTALENAIDQMNQALPPMTHFILPGGHSVVSYCHIARTICRRAERRSTMLSENNSVPPLVIKYLNRLSDYLFVLSRKLTLDFGVDEVKWEPNT